MLGSKSSGVAAGDSLCTLVSQEACVGEGAEGGHCSKWSIKFPWLIGVYSTNFITDVVSGHSREITEV